MDPIRPSIDRPALRRAVPARPVLASPAEPHRLMPKASAADALPGLAELQRALSSDVAKRAAKIGGTAAAVLLGASLLKRMGDGDAAGPAGGPAGVGAPVDVQAAKRGEIVEIAKGLIGEKDVNPDGTLNDRVRGWKSATVDGRPDDPNAAWEIAFARAVVNAAGASLGKDGKGASTTLDLQEWARSTGHFRPAEDQAARAKGNLVLLVRKDARGLTWHDVGVVLGPSKDGKGLVVAAGNRLAGNTATVDGKQVYVGSVGFEEISFDATLEGVGHQIEGFIDVVSKPLEVEAPTPVDPAVAEARKRSEIVARAAAKVGVTEDGRRANRGAEVDVFWKSAGDAALADSDRLWCAAFTSWLYNEQRMPYATREGEISTVAIRQWAIEAGAWRPRGEHVPKPGDLIEFKFPDRPGVVNHIGIVERVDSDGTIHTIEGNTSSKAQSSNGGGVFRKSHAPGSPLIIGYVDVFDYYRRHPEGPTTAGRF